MSKICEWSTRYHSWLKHCLTSWKVAGSIPDGVREFFNDLTLSAALMALGVDSASNGNEYLGSFLAIKEAGARG
jgi:hypothetical protein